MDFAKVAVCCTIDFLPDTGETDAVVALRDENEKWYGCREQRFAVLQDAPHVEPTCSAGALQTAHAGG
jgi:hypothetical protein